MLADLTVWGIAGISIKMIVYFGCFVAAGSVLFALLNPALDERLRRKLCVLALALALTATAASLLQMGVQAGQLLDEGISGMLDPEMLELVFSTPLGLARDRANLRNYCGPDHSHSFAGIW